MTTGTRIKRQTLPSEVYVAAFLLLVFVLAFREAVSLPGEHAAAFPRDTSLVGAVLCAGLLVWSLVRLRVGGVREEEPPPALIEVDQEAAEESGMTGYSVQAELKSASTAAWVQAIGWVIAYFAGLWALGMYPITFLFSALYVVIVGRVRIPFAVLYAGALVGVLYLVFKVALGVLVPAGALLQ